MIQPTTNTIDPRTVSNELAKLLKDCPNIKVSLTPLVLCSLIVDQQRALRHLGNGGAAQVVEREIRKWIKKLPVAAQPYMEAGFNSNLDV